MFLSLFVSSKDLPISYAIWEVWRTEIREDLKFSYMVRIMILLLINKDF